MSTQPSPKAPIVFAGPKDLAYIKPAGRRLTEYEAVNCSLQTNPDGWDVPGWFAAFATGRGTWDASLTQVQSSDWFAFRDPAQIWQRPYIRRQNDQERAIARWVKYGIEEGLAAKIDPQWSTDAIGNVYVPFAFFEDALFRAFAYAQRESLSDTISACCTFNATDKVRHTQDIILYHLALIDAGVPIRGDDGRPVWMEDPSVQGVRRIAERLLACDDWAEVALVTNLLVEPVVAAAVFNDILLGGASAHGDLVTPVLLVEADRDRQRNIAWTVALCNLLTTDPVHAEANQAVISGWLRNWYGEVRETMNGLSDWSGLGGLTPEGLKERAMARLAALSRQLQLEFEFEPVGIQS